MFVSNLVEHSSREVVCDESEAVLRSFELVVELLVNVATLLLRLNDVHHFP